MTARILVVDDIAANLRLLEAKLQAEYYEVALAGSGPEALALAARWNPDVILLDVMMPGMDGYEVCRRLKAEPTTAHLPVVMVTALVDQAERVRGLEAGADDFLSKPVDDTTLFARLRALLRVKQVQDAWRQQAAVAHDLGIEVPPAPPESLGDAAVLVVSSQPRECEEIAETLAADGIRVRAMAEPEAARPVLMTGEFDLAVLCLDTEDGAGMLRFTSRLRAEGVTRDLPVLLVGDAAQRSLLLRGFELGASDHALRPVDPNELRARVRNQIRRKRYQDRLQTGIDRSLELAVTDPLTGLRNRRYVHRHLDGVLREQAAAVMLVDIDRFKQINDTHGHAAGDAALRLVAERLRRHLRAVDLIARYGGEEFIVVLTESQIDSAAMVAERLRAAMAQEPIRSDGLMLPITVSIGLAIAPKGSTAEQAIGAADTALYRAKEAGRNRVEAAREGDLDTPSAGVATARIT